MFYYCTCSKRDRGNVKRGKTPYRMVDVNKEGVCEDCGYYAIASRVVVKGRNDLYNYLFNRKELVDELARPTPGGLSIKDQKKLKKRRGLSE